MLPILQATLAGLGAVLTASVMSVASGMGMGRSQQLYQVELPLAAPVILAGIRASVIVVFNLRRCIASAVGAGTLRARSIIIGLSGFNTAYVIEGALLVALAASLSIACLKADARAYTRHAKDKTVTCQHHAADTANSHQQKGDHPIFATLILMLIKRGIH